VEPVKMTVSGSQAKATVTISIPYGFVAQSTRLAQFVTANKAPAGTPAPTAPTTTDQDE